MKQTAYYINSLFHSRILVYYLNIKMLLLLVHHNLIKFIVLHFLHSSYLTHSIQLVSLFLSPWKHKKTRGFLMFSGGIERGQWHEMGQQITLKFICYQKSSICYLRMEVKKTFSGAFSTIVKPCFWETENCIDYLFLEARDEKLKTKTNLEHSTDCTNTQIRRMQIW